MCFGRVSLQTVFEQIVLWEMRQTGTRKSARVWSWRQLRCQQTGRESLDGSMWKDSQQLDDSSHRYGVLWSVCSLGTETHPLVLECVVPTVSPSSLRTRICLSEVLHPAGPVLCLSPQFDLLLGGTADFSVSLCVIYEDRWLTLTPQLHSKQPHLYLYFVIGLEGQIHKNACLM